MATVPDGSVQINQFENIAAKTDELVKNDRSKDRKPDEDKGDTVNAKEDERMVPYEADQKFDARQSDDKGGQKPDCQVIEMRDGEDGAVFIQVVNRYGQHRLVT